GCRQRPGALSNSCRAWLGTTVMASLLPEYLREDNDDAVFAAFPVFNVVEMGGQRASLLYAACKRAYGVIRPAHADNPAWPVRWYAVVRTVVGGDDFFHESQLDPQAHRINQLAV